MKHYEIAAGSIVGWQHTINNGLLIGRNNQDGCALHKGRDLIVAVLTDGCSGSRAADVGARFAAPFLATSIERNHRSLVSGGSANVLASGRFWGRVRQDLLAELHQLAVKFTPPGESYTKTVREYLLFTVLAAVLDREGAVIAAIGDGVFSVNGESRRLEACAGNQPAYPAYALIESGFSAKNELLRFSIVAQQPADSLEALLIGTDGVTHLIDAEQLCLPGRPEKVGPLSQFWEEDRYFRNPDMLRRKLALLNSGKHVLIDGQRSYQTGLLPDDTTLAVIRRTPGKEAVNECQN